MSVRLGRRLLSTYKLPPTINQLLSRHFDSTKPPSQPATVHGWVKSIRRQKNVSFAVITDGSSAAGMQAVFAGEKNFLAKGFVLIVMCSTLETDLLEA